MVAFLVSKGADLSIRARATDWPTQISNEPRVQYRPTGGLTPLLYAARAGCLGCVKAMLDAGADKDRPNPDGMTPMLMALDNGHPDVAQYLLDHGANPHTWDWWGRTPLYVAVTMRGGQDGRPGPRSPESLAFIKALLDAEVNPNAQLAFKEPSRGGRDNRFRDDLLTTGATPLLRAAQTFDDEVVRALLDHGALVDLPNASGVTPFMAAAGIGTRTAAGRARSRSGRQRGRALSGNAGDPAQGGCGRERPHHRHHQLDGSHRAAQHADRPAGADARSFSPPRSDGSRWSGICSITVPDVDVMDDMGRRPIDVAAGSGAVGARPVHLRSWPCSNAPTRDETKSASYRSSPPHFATL